MGVRVTCVNKSNGYHQDPHHAITRLGWVNDQTSETGFSSREEMWDFVNRGGQAYVRDGSGRVAYLRARTSSNGTHYVQTEADGVLTDNLLYLGECR